MVWKTWMNLQCILQIMTLETSGKLFGSTKTEMLWGIWLWYTCKTSAKTTFPAVQLHNYINQLIDKNCFAQYCCLGKTNVHSGSIFFIFLLLQLDHLPKQVHICQMIQQEQHAELVHNFDVMFLHIPFPPLEKYWILFIVLSNTWLNNCVDIWCPVIFERYSSSLKYLLLLCSMTFSTESSSPSSSNVTITQSCHGPKLW